MSVETKPAGGNGGNRRRGLVITDWKPFEKNTLKGFCTIITPPGIRIKGCTAHEKDGKRWVNLPARPWTNSDGSISYVAVIDFTDIELRKRFQDQALAALDDLLKPKGGEA